MSLRALSVDTAIAFCDAVSLFFLEGSDKMKVRELLESLDAIKPNEIRDDIKLRWVGEVEGRAMCEICKADPTEIKRAVGEEDELSVLEPYSRVYLLYLIAMVELAAGDISAYSSVSAEYEKAFTEYGKWYMRNKR